MAKNEIEPPPEWLDLGDLSSLAVGDEVAPVCIVDGKLKIGSTVYLIYKLEGWRTLVRRPDRETSLGGWLTKNCGATRGMYGPTYYHSANPKHIAAAKANGEAIARKVAKEKAVRDALLAQAIPIGKALGDEDFNEEEGPHPIASALASNLTTEQLTTMAGWLNL